MDAEHLDFPDGSFDFIWSWGVIHHSADTNQVLREVSRVLRPGGTFVAMVYYRSWWSYYAFGGIRRLFLPQFKGRSLHEIAQAGTDGAIARYYSRSEWRAATNGLFAAGSTRICGLKTDVLPLPPGRLKSSLEASLPDWLTRFMTNQLRMGSFLVAEMRKP
jgi:SAM-dependent methyltransferase